MMSDEQVSIDNVACYTVAESIKAVGIRDSFYSRPFLNAGKSTEIALRGYFYSVAICHQTYHLFNTELNLFGWDYLEYVFSNLMNRESELLFPGYFTTNNPVFLQEQLQSLFPRNSESNLTSLDRIEERVQMLIELDGFIEATYNSSLLKLISCTNGLLLKEGRGLYEILSVLLAFADPFKKKITFLVKLLEEARLIEIKDPHNFIPIMDYHMQRVLLRLGCVEVNDLTLRHKLLHRDKLPSDLIIREACINAFNAIAQHSGIRKTKLNDYFWSLGRSCCNEKPLCEFHQCEKSPCTFYNLIDLKEHRECFFAAVCKGNKDSAYRSMWQPVIETNYY